MGEIRWETSLRRNWVWRRFCDEFGLLKIWVFFYSGDRNKYSVVVVVVVVVFVLLLFFFLNRNHFLKLKTISVFVFALRLDYKQLFWKWARVPPPPHLPTNSENRTYKNLGFGIRDTGLRIPCQWNLHSGFQSLYRFQSPGFRTPQAKLFGIPKSRFSYIGRHSSTSFFSSIPPLKH